MLVLSLTQLFILAFSLLLHSGAVGGMCPNLKWGVFKSARIFKSQRPLMNYYVPLVSQEMERQGRAKPDEADEICQRFTDWATVFLRTIERRDISAPYWHLLTSLFADLIGVPLPDRDRLIISPTSIDSRISGISEIPAEVFWGRGIDLLTLAPFVIPALYDEIGLTFKDIVEIHEAAARLDDAESLPLAGFMIHYFRSLKLYRNHHPREPKLVFPPSNIFSMLKNVILGYSDKPAAAHLARFASCMIKVLDSLEFETVPRYSLFGRTVAPTTWLWKKGALRPFAGLVKDFLTREAGSRSPSRNAKTS